VHDYHFFLLGQELRNAGWRGPIGYFLHIPFPAPEVFTALPTTGLARGLADFDLLGFQTERDTRNFIRYMVEHHGATELGDGRLTVFDRTITARAFPIGIDPAEIARFATSETAAPTPTGSPGSSRTGRWCSASTGWTTRRACRSGSRPSAGCSTSTRSSAAASPSCRSRRPRARTSTPTRSCARSSTGLAGRINSDLFRPRLDADPLPRPRLPARDAGRALPPRPGRLVTPLYDGMNLVAKEYVAAQDPEDPGVLVLSEFAGAAEQLSRR
jgi:trehalose 6-phosphate synthase